MGQQACNRRIHNVIVHAQPSHILISNKALLVISKETKSTVSDDFKLSWLSDNHLLKLPFELLEACFRSREASWIWMPHLSIIIQFLPDIVVHILRWRQEDVIERMVATATKHRPLGTSCAISWLATMNDTKKHWVVQFHRRLYPSGSSSVIEDWGNMTGVRTTICIRLLLAASMLSDSRAWASQTGGCSIDDRPNAPIED